MDKGSLQVRMDYSHCLLGLAFIVVGLLQQLRTVLAH
jgi:hypothetical protein